MMAQIEGDEITVTTKEGEADVSTAMRYDCGHL